MTVQEGSSQVVALRTGPFTIGRAVDADLIIDDPSISRLHTRLPVAESELFGHERGAFSGSTAAKQGFFEAAAGGVLFLDEIGELSLPLQARLLRAAETHQIVRLGDSRSVAVEVRVIAATHRDLAAEVRAGRFREDLYFRLCAARVALPALRSRPREIPLLARTFLARACAALGLETPAISAAAMAQLSLHAWPGNVRELRNLMAAMAALHEGPIIEEVALGEGREVAPAPPRPVQKRKGFATSIGEEIKALERARMVEALAASHQVLGSTLYNVTALTFGRDNARTDLYTDVDATRSFDFTLGTVGPVPLTCGGQHDDGTGETDEGQRKSRPVRLRSPSATGRRSPAS